MNDALINDDSKDRKIVVVMTINKMIIAYVRTYVYIYIYIWVYLCYIR